MDDDLDRERPRRASDPYSGRRPRRDDRSGEPLAGAERTRVRRSGRDLDAYEPSRGERRLRDRESLLGDDVARPPERFRRPSRESLPSVDQDDRSYRSTRDPYDRLRRVGNRASTRRVEIDDADFGDEYLDERDENVRSTPGRRLRSTQRPAATREFQARLGSAGRSLMNPAADTRPLSIGLAAALGSLLLLAILVLIRSGSTDAWIPLHLNAEGVPVGYGSKSAIWRLPFFALLTTIMAFGIGWWLRTREPFAAQYLVVGTLLIHGLIWVGTIRLLW